MKPVSLLKSGLWITYATFITRITAFLSSLILARLLNPADFGVIGIAYVFWSFFMLFIQDTAGTFIIYKGTDSPKYVNTAYTISLLTGLAFGLGMVGLAPFIAIFFNEASLTWILIAFSFNLVLNAINCVQSSVMTRQMQYQSLANISLFVSAIRLLCTAGAAFLGLGYWSFVIGDAASLFASCVLTRYYARYRFRLQIDPEVRSEVLSFCLNSVGSSFGLYANFNLDNLTVGKLLGSASLGYYSLAYQLTAAIPSILSPVFNQLGTPVFAQLSSQDQEHTLHKVVERVALLAAPICALFFLVFDPQVVGFIFGIKWIPISSLIPGLMVFTYFRIVNSSLYSMLVATGRPDINAKVNLAVAPVAVLSFIIGAQKGGIVGVSIAVGLALGIGWTLYWWWFSCRTMNWSLKKFLISCFIPFLLTLPAIAASYQLPLLIRPFTFSLIYLICIRCLTPKYFSIYQEALSQFGRRLLKVRPSS